MSHEFRDLFNIEVDEFQKKAKVSTPSALDFQECLLGTPTQFG